MSALRASRRPSTPALHLVVMALVCSPLSASGSEVLEAIRGQLATAQSAATSGELEVAESRWREAGALGLGELAALAAAAGDLARADLMLERAGTLTATTRGRDLDLAIVRLRRGRPDEAIGLLRAVVGRYPTDHSARLLLGRALVATRQPGLAIPELEEVLRADPNDPEATFALATAFAARHEDDSADRSFERLAEISPNAATAVLIGRSWRDLGDYPRARRWLERALAIDAEAPRARRYLATVELLETGGAALPRAEELLRAELERDPSDHVSTVTLALALIDARRCAEAVPLLRALPGHASPDAAQALGRCAALEGDHGGAVVHFERALELFAARGDTTDRPGKVHYELGKAHRALGDQSKAETHFDAARQASVVLATSARSQLEAFLAEDPGVVDGDRTVSLAASQLDRYASVVPDRRLDLTRELSRSAARALFDLGVLEVRSQRAAAATQLFSQAAELDSRLPGIDRSLGIAAFGAQRWALAAPALRRAFEANPGEPALRRMAAVAALENDDPATAAALLDGDPSRDEDPALSYVYGLALVRSGRTDQALGSFEALLSRHPQEARIQLILAAAHAEDGNFAEARTTVGAILAREPTTPDAHELLGIMAFRQGNLDDAATALRAELELQPQDRRSRRLLATVLDLAGRSDQARGELQLVLAAHPDDAEARYLLGKIELAAGRLDLARDQLEAAAQLDPSRPEVHNQLGLLYRNLGDTSRSAHAFALFRELKRERRDTP